ncbi:MULTISPECIES: FkbM family methyltransferase [unclassified Bradyrhizobium]
MRIAHAVRRKIQSVAAKSGYLIERRYDLEKYRLNLLELVVKQAAPSDPNFFFLQAGANDGEAFDPINLMVRNYRWRGVLLEPQPDVFKRLVANYKGHEDHLTFENSALTDVDGERPFWTVAEQTGLGSFDKDMIYRSAPKGATFIERRVMTISPRTLFEKHNINRIDLLQVDTEGFDFEIIKLIIGSGINPRLINYEHVHLSSNDRQECATLLGERGYRLCRAGHYGTDTLALLAA